MKSVKACEQIIQNPLSLYSAEAVDAMVDSLEKDVHGVYGSQQIPNALKEKAQAIANIIDEEGLRDELDFEVRDSAYKAFFGWLQRHNPFDENHKQFKHNFVDKSKSEFNADKRDWSKVVKMQDLLTLPQEDRDALMLSRAIIDAAMQFLPKVEIELLDNLDKASTTSKRHPSYIKDLFSTITETFTATKRRIADETLKQMVTSHASMGYGFSHAEPLFAGLGTSVKQTVDSITAPMLNELFIAALHTKKTPQQIASVMKQIEEIMNNNSNYEKADPYEIFKAQVDAILDDSPQPDPNAPIIPGDC